MARDSQDHEDLLRDATAFTTRVQLILPHEERPAVVFAGFRTAGAVSLYFDQDPVYHFNGQTQLRRAFINGRLIKAENGRLVGWTRQRTESEVVMLRKEFSSGEQQAFCDVASQQLRQLQQTLAAENYEIEGAVQADPGASALNRLEQFLALIDTIQVADSPHVAG